MGTSRFTLPLFCAVLFLDSHLGATSAIFQGGNYNRNVPTVNDPILSYSISVGGLRRDEAHGVAVDGSGNVYVVGTTFSTDFPSGAPEQELKGNSDVFVSKFSPSGILLYSVFIGGHGDEQGSSIAVDPFDTSDSYVYVVGQTDSEDFPTVNALQGSFGGGESDAFVLKLRGDDGQLEMSTYWGGSDRDSAAGVTVAGRDVYLTGVTYSPDFPLVNPFQMKLPGECLSGSSTCADAFVTKLNAAQNIIRYSTYLGGSSTDVGTAIGLDAADNVLVTGSTSSEDFPTKNPIRFTLRSALQVFVTKLNPDGSDLVYSTYLGGTSSNWPAGIAVDRSGSAYVVGFTNSSNFPLLNAFQEEQKGATDGFVSKFAPDGQLAYSTYLGGSVGGIGAPAASPGWDKTCGIAVDAAGHAYVTGLTLSTDFPIVDAFQENKGGSTSDRDAFIAKLSASGDSLVYASYLGGSAADEGTAIAVDEDGDAFVVGFTASSDFPRAGSVETELAGDVDVFVARVTEARALHFAQYGDGEHSGASVASQITVANLDAERAANVRIEVRDDGGEPLETDLNGMVVQGVLETVIPARGSEIGYKGFQGLGDDLAEALPRPLRVLTQSLN